MKLLLVLGFVALVRSDGYGDEQRQRYQEVSYSKTYLYHGKYGGQCDNDGLYFRDDSSFVICTNGNNYVQPCAPGTSNAKFDSYSYGNSYGTNAFCAVNLVDYGYGAKTRHYGTPVEVKTVVKGYEKGKERSYGYDNKKDGYGDDKSSSGYGEKRGYKVEKTYTDYEKKDGYGSPVHDNRRDSYGSQNRRDSYGSQDSYGRDRSEESYGNGRRGYGSIEPHRGYGDVRRGYGDVRRGYGNDRRGFGNNDRHSFGGYDDRNTGYDTPKYEVKSYRTYDKRQRGYDTYDDDRRYGDNSYDDGHRGYGVRKVVRNVH